MTDSPIRRKVMLASHVLSLILLAAGGFRANAQWLKYATPGLPRTSDGKLDLHAPAHRSADGKPDRSGLWNGSALPDLKTIPLRPEARAAVERFRSQINNRDTTLARCLPTFLLQAIPTTLFKIVQTPKLVVMLFENYGMPLPRQVFLDGRPLPDAPNPAWMGYSIGHWEGDTLVVQTAGFNDRGTLPTGIPITESTHITERYRRLDFGHLKLQITVEDPQTFTVPWAFDLNSQVQADNELLEFVCEGNEDILRHMVVGSR
jgi:hypothetical protein